MSKAYNTPPPSVQEKTKKKIPLQGVCEEGEKAISSKIAAPSGPPFRIVRRGMGSVKGEASRGPTEA